MNFYIYRLMIRGSAGNVDMHAEIETERLQYLRSHQQSLRSKEYTTSRDAVPFSTAIDIGPRVTLPATFTGSSRHTLDYAQDALSNFHLRAHLAKN